MVRKIPSSLVLKPGNTAAAAAGGGAVAAAAAVVVGIRLRHAIRMPLIMVVLVGMLFIMSNEQSAGVFVLCASQILWQCTIGSQRSILPHLPLFSLRSLFSYSPD